MDEIVNLLESNISEYHYEKAVKRNTTNVVEKEPEQDEINKHIYDRKMHSSEGRVNDFVDYDLFDKKEKADHVIQPDMSFGGYKRAEKDTDNDHSQVSSVLESISEIFLNHCESYDSKIFF